jgi:CheY-like chemotaxis protein
MKKTILLVEGSKVQKRASERILLKAGYLVLFAGDGEEALRLARESAPDLVLLDLLNITGDRRRRGPAHTQARSAYRADSGDCRQPSSTLPPTNSDQLNAAGAADYLEKSRLEDEGEAVFLGTIKRVLRESEERNEEGTHVQRKEIGDAHYEQPYRNHPSSLHRSE